MNMTAHDGTHLMMFVSFLCLECRGGYFFYCCVVECHPVFVDFEMFFFFFRIMFGYKWVTVHIVLTCIY